jgi:Xaa-Pro dipeptidase
VLAGEKATLLRDSDQLMPFRQRRYFYYLSGCNESDCYIIYNIAKDVLTLYIPKVDLRHAVWGGAGSTKTEALAKYDVDAVEYISELRKAVLRGARPEHPGQVYFLNKSDIDIIIPDEVSA